MAGPILWGPNNTSNNLQNAILQANGTQLVNNGAKNYISYNNFENGLTTGWSLGTVGTLTNGIPTGTPTFGSGAAGTLTISAATGSIIAGRYSLQYADTNSGGTTVGNMLATQAYTIDNADQAKVLTFQFYYQITVGVSGANFSGTSSNSFGVAIWDATNSVWLTSTAQFGMTQNSGVGYCTGTCQTGASTSSIQLVIYNANATTAATTMLFDQFFLGPQTAPLGAVIGDWTAYTPTLTGYGTVSNASAYWRRVGDSAHIIGSFTTGTVSTPLASITLPSGLSINSAKLSINNTTSNPGNEVGSFNTDGAASLFCKVVTAPSTSTSVVYVGSTNAGTAALTPAEGQNTARF